MPEVPAKTVPSLTLTLAATASLDNPDLLHWRTQILARLRAGQREPILTAALAPAVGGHVSAGQADRRREGRRGVETPPETAPWRIEDVIEEQ